MKKFIFTSLAVLSVALLHAQLKEGRIIYERTTQLKLSFRNAEAEAMFKDVPKTQVASFELLFGNNQSLWQSLPDVNQEASQMSGSETGGKSFMIKSFGGDDVVYHNFGSGKKIVSRELSNKKYIVEDTIAKLTWKMTEESKTFLNYRVMKATAQMIAKRTVSTMENGEMKRKEMPDTMQIVAWFTTDIKIPAGPAYQGQLPGLILELSINNDQTVYKATEISPKVTLASIKEPKGGKRITNAEYVSEMEKVMEEHRKRLAENGGRITIPVAQ
ncbi:MAG TPA: GLPGLI family protein [Flavisolibacter sp.]|nr:GLPGLI family protein [Flavisolibacter sp.]